MKKWFEGLCGAMVLVAIGVTVITLLYGVWWADLLIDVMLMVRVTVTAWIVVGVLFLVDGILGL